MCEPACRRLLHWFRCRSSAPALGAGCSVCLILFAYRLHPQRPLVVAANRDEYYARPALPAHWWGEAPGRVFGGRDQTAGGTWLAVSKHGHLAAVTNWTEDRNRRMPASRGDLPLGFLAAGASGRDFIAGVDGSRYAGYNFIGFDGEELIYTSNRTGEARLLEPGIYGLTNTRLGTGLAANGERIPVPSGVDAPHHAYEEWPKAVLGTAALKHIAAAATTEALIELLSRPLLPLETPADREMTPERSYSPAFIHGVEYGTRASTAIIVERESLAFVEQQHGPHGKPGKRTAERFAIEPAVRACSKNPQLGT